MHYSKKMQAENKVLKAVIARHEESLREISTYLLSSKFSKDHTVQVTDILTRVTRAQCAATDVLFNESAAHKIELPQLAS